MSEPAGTDPTPDAEPGGTPPKGALAGIRVVDFTHVLAGPACGYFLSLLGADVVKVESVGRGDAMRHRGGTDGARAAAGMSTAYLTQGGGKRSLALDLEQADGREVLHRLLARSDVLVENHRPSTLAGLGLDADTLARVAPRLVHCAMTGYGRGGPLADAPAYDVNIQASSGLMSLTGTTDSGPTRTGAPIIDYATALAAGFAVAAALLERERTGIAKPVDVSMLETAHVLMASTITDHLATGHVPTPRGNAANSRSPGAGSFACRVGTLSLGVNEEPQFRALAHAIGRGDWLDDARFATRESRTAHAAELERELAEALARRDADDWETRLLDAGVPAARLRTLPESLATAQVAARGFLHVDEASGMTLPTLPFRLGEGGHVPDRSPPELGADTDAVLAELGYCAERVAALRASGAVG